MPSIKRLFQGPNGVHILHARSQKICNITFSEVIRSTHFFLLSSFNLGPGCGQFTILVTASDSVIPCVTPTLNSDTMLHAWLHGYREWVWWWWVGLESDYCNCYSQNCAFQINLPWAIPLWPRSFICLCDLLKQNSIVKVCNLPDNWRGRSH